MKKLFLIILTGLIFIACEKEKIVIKEVEKEFNWKMHTNFQYEYAVQMNSFSTDEYLFFYGLYWFSVIGVDSRGGGNFLDTISGTTMMNYPHWVPDQHTQYKFPVSKNFFIEYETDADFLRKDDKLWFVPSINPSIGNTSITFSIKDIDNSFIRYNFHNYTRGECIAINSNDQALIPYYGLSSGKSTFKLALVNIKVNSNVFVSLDTLKTRIITLNDDNQRYALYIQHIDKNFFLTTDTKTYRINSAGDISGIYDSMSFS